MTEKWFTGDCDEVWTVLDAAPLPLIVSRVSDGTVLYANPPLGSLVGLRPSELVGQMTPDYYADPEDRRALVAALEKHGQVTGYELRLKHVDGGERWAVASVVAIELRGEAVIVAGLNDITGRKLAQLALAESEKRFRVLVENANDIIYMLTPDGIFTYVSPNWTSILGHDLAEVVGQPFMPMIHPDDLPACLEFLNEVLETGERKSGIEYRVKHKDGSWRWHTSNASALKDPNGNVEAFIGIARDVTEMKEDRLALEKAHRELKEAQVHLVQSEKMAALGNLVAGIAHDINSPVGAISSMQNTLSIAIDKLQKALIEAAPQLLDENREIRAALGAMVDADRVIGMGAARVTEIVTGLRRFARLDEGELKKADIHEGIEGAVTLVQHDLKGRVEIERHYADLEPIMCYPGKLNQVFLNILVNASQAIESEGKITITTSKTGNEIHVAIGDTGKGIPQKDLKSIFDPGFTTKGVRVGTGLGLSICYQILQQHKGRVEVESEVGKGSVFSVILPSDLEEPAFRPR